MRSDRVFDALQTLRNRYMLCQLASKATRKFHRPSTRIQETMNGVLDRIAGAERQEILSEPENFAEAQRRPSSHSTPFLHSQFRLTYNHPIRNTLPMPHQNHRVMYSYI